MHTKFPVQAALSNDDRQRINAARLALLLHKTPAEIRAMPYEDVRDVIAVHDADQTLQAMAARRRR